MIPDTLIGRWVEARRVDHMPRECIYCGHHLPSKSNEHVFSSCWGGSRESSKLICDSCNSAFGSIENAFAPYTSFIMNAWGIKAKRSKAIPTVKLEKHELKAFGRPRLHSSTVHVLDKANEGQRLALEAPTRARAMELAEPDGELERVLGRSLADKEREMIRAAVKNSKSKD